jgi:hypothetical protein
MIVACQQHLKMGPAMILQKVWTALPPCEGYAAAGLDCIEGRRELHGNLLHYRQFGVGAYRAATGYMHFLDLLLTPAGGAALLVFLLI